jgi:hypothetical protein
MAVMAGLNKMAAYLDGLSRSPAPAAMSTTTQFDQFRSKWLAEREAYLNVLEARMVPRYVAATLLARRYALESSEIAHTSERLQSIASMLGDPAMSAFLANMIDPTDPDGRRSLAYVHGAFAPRP